MLTTDVASAMLFTLQIQKCRQSGVALQDLFPFFQPPYQKVNDNLALLAYNQAWRVNI